MQFNVNRFIEQLAVLGGVVALLNKISDFIHSRQSEIDQASTAVKCDLPNSPWEDMSGSIKILTEAIEASRPRGWFTKFPTVREACKNIVKKLKDIKCYNHNKFVEHIEKIDGLNQNNGYGNKILEIFYGNFPPMSLINCIEPKNNNFNYFSTVVKTSVIDAAKSPEYSAVKDAEESYKKASQEFADEAKKYTDMLDALMKFGLVKVNGDLCDKNNSPIFCDGKKLRAFTISDSNKQEMSLSFKEKFITYAILLAYVVVTDAIYNDRALCFFSRHKILPNVMARELRNKKGRILLEKLFVCDFKNIPSHLIFFPPVKSSFVESDYISEAYRFLKFVLKFFSKNEIQIINNYQLFISDSDLNKILGQMDKLIKLDWVKKVCDQNNKKYLHEPAIRRTIIEKFEDDLKNSLKVLFKYTSLELNVPKISNGQSSGNTVKYNLTWSNVQKILNGNLSGDTSVEKLRKSSEDVVKYDQIVKEKFGDFMLTKNDYNAVYIGNIEETHVDILNSIDKGRYLFTTITEYKEIFEKLCDIETLANICTGLNGTWKQLQNHFTQLGLGSKNNQEEFDRTNVSASIGTDSTAKKSTAFANQADIDYNKEVCDFAASLTKLNGDSFKNGCINSVVQTCLDKYNKLKKSIECMESTIDKASNMLSSQGANEIPLSMILCNVIAVLSTYALALNLYYVTFEIFFNHKCHDLVKTSKPLLFVRPPNNSVEGRGGLVSPKSQPPETTQQKSLPTSATLGVSRLPSRF